MSLTKRTRLAEPFDYLSVEMQKNYRLDGQDIPEYMVRVRNLETGRSLITTVECAEVAAKAALGVIRKHRARIKREEADA